MPKALELFNLRQNFYNPLLHFFLVISSNACYGLLRYWILINTNYRFSWWGSNSAQFTYEALELYPYVFLSAGGSVVLEYVWTGAHIAPQTQRSQNELPEGYKFPYLLWNIQGKLRKCLAFIISSSMFGLVSYTCGHVWAWGKDDKELDDKMPLPLPLQEQD